MKNKKFLDRIENYLSKEVFPGCEFAIIKDKHCSEFCMGNAAIIPQKVALQAGGIWDLASVSKVLAVGTMIIHQFLEGKIELDRTLRSYYPDWHEDSVTIRGLLTHTSGIDPFIENRNQMSYSELREALNHLKVKERPVFQYTDVNFILLGFLLEQREGKDLSEINEQLFQSLGMLETSYRPVRDPIPTSLDCPIGEVHDPKAKVLGGHCGSAGLFSSLSDLEKFVQFYFADEKYLQLCSNFSQDKKVSRSLAWAMLNPDWLIHTGYTGTFIMMNLRKKEAVIFLSNRVHLKDERDEWISDRDLLIQDFLDYFE